jgi:hypothetical protein
MGLVATMSALVLGLFVADAKGSFDGQKNALTDMCGRILQLDQYLSRYGPESADAKSALRTLVLRARDEMWNPPSTRVSGWGEALYERVERLSPSNEAQRSLRDQSLSLIREIGRTRWLMVAKQGGTISTPFLVVVVFWITITFVSFGYFAPPNATASVALFLAALSVAGAIFVTLEMDRAFTGIIRVSDGPVRAVLAQLGE